jgi:putative membrane protein
MKHIVSLGSLLLGAVLTLSPAITIAQSSGTDAGQEGTTEQSGSMKPSGTQAKQTPGTTLSTDQKFVRAAAEGGMAEVELGQLAAQKASSEDVKKFAQRMVDDHSKANDQLKQIASSENIDLPKHLNAKDRALKMRLSKLSGDQFDHVYMENMVKDHKQDVADFQRESSSGNDAQVKEFATKTLPTLQDHLQQAQSIEPNTKTSSNTGMNSQK